MNRPRMKQKIYYFQLLKIVIHLLNKYTQNHKKHSNSDYSNKGEAFSIKPCSILGLGSQSMIRLTSLDVYTSIFKIKGEKNKFKLYVFPDSEKGGDTYEKVRDVTEKDLEMSDVTATNLQEEILGPIFFEGNRKEASKRMKSDKYMDITLIPYFKTLKVI